METCTKPAVLSRGCQTDETKKRCWRHRRPSPALPEVTPSECPAHSRSSTLLNALPSVHFPKWNRTIKKDVGLSTLVENYLGCLYAPYSSVQKQLLEQASSRCKDVGQEFFEADYLRPVAGVLRAVLDHERNRNHRLRIYHKKHRRHRRKKTSSGWPLCSRGCLIVHIHDPDQSFLKPGDFYFVASRVGVSLKWKVESEDPVRERSLDPYEFSVEMASLVGSKSSSSNDEEDEEDSLLDKTHLVVAPEGGISKIAVSQLLEELFECSRKRNRLKCTRDSWVQTEKDHGEKAVAEDTLQSQSLAPLASEEEFCSDTETKAKSNHAEESLQGGDAFCVDIRQPTAIADIHQDVLYSQVAVMPGCRDISSRSIVFVSLNKLQLHSINAIQLAEILLYFQSIPKKETMCLGFLTLVDGRDASVSAWCILHKALAIVEKSVPGTVSLVLALHYQSHKCELLSSKFPIFHLKFKSIVNENQLLKYVEKDQLLSEFCGTFEYSHQEWMDFHEFLDPFIVSCHQMGCHLVKLIQDLRDGQLPTVLTNQLIDQQKKQIMAVLENEQLRYLEEEGANFLHKLEIYHEKFINNPDFEEAEEKSRLLYKQLKKVVQRLEKLANKRLNKLQEHMMMKLFEEESSQILSWLHCKGEETLKKHKTLAESLNSIREQEIEFEKFYFMAMRQIERGNDLLEEIPKTKNCEKQIGISDNLKTQLDDFTERLEDAREALEDTSRCYRLLDRTYEWSLETMRFVSHMKVDSTTSVSALTVILKKLDSYLQEHPYLEDGVFDEMIHLAAKQNNDSLLEQCLNAKAKYSETVELIEIRRQTLLKSKESMNFEEKPNISESLDNLKIKPCLWNPLTVTSPYRSSSQTFLNGSKPLLGFQDSRRESIGSYTSFPSSYYPSSGSKERLINLSQNKKRNYFAKRNSLTDEMIYGKAYTFSESTISTAEASLRNSYPLYESLTNLNSSSTKEQIPSNLLCNLTQQQQTECDRNFKKCEDELKKFADEVKKQNELLKQQMIADVDCSKVRKRSIDRLQSGNLTSPNSTILNPEELKKSTPLNAQLTRCASCSDFEELLFSNSSGVENLKLINNRTLKLIMMEMIQTERDYVKSLGYIIENYVPLLQGSEVNQALRSQRNVIFGNIEKIYEFHNCYFLGELEKCESSPYSVGHCFLDYENQFYLYALYNKNKPKSDTLMAEYGNFFKKKQQELGDKMDLASYLLKPVQRMGKYALLLKQLLKECPQTNCEYYNNLKAAEEMVRFQLRHGNDLLSMDALKECDVNIKEQGRLLRQDEFLVGKGKSRKALRRVFLFEDLIIFSKTKRDPECKGHDYYQYKSSMKTSDLGLTAQVGESPTKFEIWFRKCKVQDLLILQAPSAEVKNAWVEEITALLWKQAERNRNLRMEEMSSMGIGNKPCLDITPSQDQISDRSISLQQLNKVPRFRNSIAISNTDNFNNNELRKRPLSISSFGSSSSGDCQGLSTFYDNVTPFYDTADPLLEVEEIENEKRRSVTQQSQCSAESGVFDLSTSGDSYVENDHRLKTIERSDSIISQTSYTSIEATFKEAEISMTISSPTGQEV